MNIDQRLAELGIALPAAAAPVAAYVPAVEVGGMLHVSGQISFAEDGSLIKGRLGEDVELDAGIAAARRCGIMLLAQLKAETATGAVPSSCRAARRANRSRLAAICSARSPLRSRSDSRRKRASPWRFMLSPVWRAAVSRECR